MLLTKEIIDRQVSLLIKRNSVAQMFTEAGDKTGGCLYLLCVTFSVGELGGYMEHDFFVMEVVVDRFCACLSMRYVQASPKPREITRGQMVRFHL